MLGATLQEMAHHLQALQPSVIRFFPCMLPLGMQAAGELEILDPDVHSSCHQLRAALGDCPANLALVSWASAARYMGTSECESILSYAQTSGSPILEPYCQELRAAVHGSAAPAAPMCAEPYCICTASAPITQRLGALHYAPMSYPIIPLHYRSDLHLHASAVCPGGLLHPLPPHARSWCCPMHHVQSQCKRAAAALASGVRGCGICCCSGSKAGAGRCGCGCAVCCRASSGRRL